MPKDKAVEGPEKVEPSLREAKSAARLRHPHIVPVFDSGQDGSTLYITTAFIEGRTLLTCLLQGRPTLGGRRGRSGPGGGVAYAHDQGIVHRDIKPANIILDTKGEPYVVDLAWRARCRSIVLPGAAEPGALGVDTDKPRRRGIAGTPGYIRRSAGRRRGDGGGGPVRAGSRPL